MTESLDDLFRSVQSRFAELNALLEEARQAQDQVTAAEQALAKFTALYTAVHEEAEANYQEAVQLGETTCAAQIRDPMGELEQGPGAWIRSWRPSDPQDQE